MNAELITRLQGDAQTTPALIEAIARLNLSLAERDYDMELAETTIEQMADALRLAYRTIKNSPIEPLALDCLDEIEHLVSIRADKRSDDTVHHKNMMEKFKKLRLAQRQVAEITATNNPPPEKGSSESTAPLTPSATPLVAKRRMNYDRKKTT